MEKIYLYHIKKTGGRSLKISFFNHYCESFNINPIDIYELQSSGLKDLCFTLDDMIINTTPDEPFIFQSDHAFVDCINIPKHYFKVSIFRGPINRLLSYYRMIDRWNRTRPEAEWLKKELPYIKNGWKGFLETIPKEILLEQIRMFSPKYDLKEAFNNIISLDHVMINEQYEKDLNLLKDKAYKYCGVKFNLKMFKFHGPGKRLTDEEILGKEKESIFLVKEKLQDEYKLYDSIVMWKKNILGE